MIAYYDCGIKAAHMQKYQGMHFQVLAPYGDGFGFYNYHINHMPLHGQNTKFYIAPDSIYLLDPQEGDKDRDGYMYSALTKWWLWSGYDRVGNLQVHNRGCKSQIAIRNGNFFHWPEIIEKIEEN